MSLLAAGILFVQVRPALTSYFFGENFVYLGQYRQNGSILWRALWSASDVIFFRPVFLLFSLPWHFVLPVDPAAYHFRNLAFSIVNVVLLHRVLLHLVASRRARVIAVLFFAASKVHFTTVGYINIYDSIVMLMLLLLTLLCLLRYLERGRPADYALALLFAGLSAFSKDHGVAVVAVASAFLLRYGDGPIAWRERFRKWGPRLVPFVLLVPVYLILRIGVVGLLPSSESSLYSPGFSVGMAARKVASFTTTLANLSFRDDGRTGASGLGGALAGEVAGSKAASTAEGLMLAGFLVLVFLTLRASSRPFADLVPPLVWIAAYLGPTLLVRNVQMYYAYEAVAGAAVLLGMCLERASRRLIATWSLALVVIAVNAAVSNSRSRYDWQTVADLAAQVDRPVVHAYRGARLDSITFVTSSLPLLQYALTSDFKGPMIPELLGLPNLRIRFAEPGCQATASDSRNLVLDADAGYAPYRPARVSATLALRAISPAGADVGSAFNVQPNGASAIALTTTGAGPRTVVMLAGEPLVTGFGNTCFLTALLPDSVLRNPGRYAVNLRDGDRESNRIDFVVRPVQPGPAPAP